MKIAVCIKQVTTREWHPRLNDTKTWIRDQDAAFEMNEPDAYALEEALSLKEMHGGEVVVCSAGPARVAQVIREALARGADRAIHVENDALASADAFVTSEALASAMKEDKFDLVLTGLQSDDQGFAQVGVILAEKLGLPHATIIMEVQAEGGARALERRSRDEARVIWGAGRAATPGRGRVNPRRGVGVGPGGGWGPAASERRLRPCRAEAMEIRGEASAIGRGGGGAPPPVESACGHAEPRPLKSEARHQR